MAMLLRQRAAVLATQDVDETAAGNHSSIAFNQNARLISGEASVRKLSGIPTFYPFQSTGYFPPTVIAPFRHYYSSLHSRQWLGRWLSIGFWISGLVALNYCETHNELPMCPLLEAFDLWATMRSISGSSFGGFGNQDLMRGTNSGVRFLLVNLL